MTGMAMIIITNIMTISIMMVSRTFGMIVEMIIMAMVPTSGALPTGKSVVLIKKAWYKTLALMNMCRGFEKGRFIDETRRS
jgi:hypothetical protein